MTKKIVKPIADKVEGVSQVIEEITPVETVVESTEKAAFRLFIENYKISNPVKYEMKKEALEKQLNEIK